jgi:hypothetical protein
MIISSKKLFGTFCTIGHGFLCYVGYLGILFSKTPIQAYLVMCYNIILLFMNRFFNGCIASNLEQESIFTKTTKIGRAILVKDYENFPLNKVEEITVAIGIILLSIRIVFLLVFPSDILF